jgi:transposase
MNTDSQLAHRNLVTNSQVERAVNANAESMKGFSPRFVAKTLGVSISEVSDMCKRQTALGRLEQYDVNGEHFYRRKSKFTETVARASRNTQSKPVSEGKRLGVSI